MNELLSYGIALTGLVLALLSFFYRQKGPVAGGTDPAAWNAQQSEMAALQALLAREKERTEELQRELAQALGGLRTADAEIARLREKTENQANVHEQMKNEFKVLAQEVVQSATQQMNEQFKEGSKTQMDLVLAPFREKLDHFAERVNQTHHQGQQERISLKTEVQKLVEQNEKLNHEAASLTKALRGDVKMQGNWGEMILEQMLEKSGLTKGLEYEVQHSVTTEDGKRYQPDVLLHLPEGKQLIIDSKVSLVAFDRFVNADSDDVQKAALKEHVQSLRNHIRGLAEKNYQELKKGSLDFVFLFVPIEGAYAAALQAEPALYQEAYDRNIVLVSTANLWATLRTIAMVWRQEKQNANVQEIIRQASALYDKFVGFTDDLRKMGGQLDAAKVTYVEGMKKLTDGRGNLVTSVEKLRLLGLKNSKSQNPTLVERASAKEVDLNDGAESPSPESSESPEANA
jgi:DNA recombination protein RmuC